MKHKKWYVPLICAGLLLLFVLWVIWGNQAVKATVYHIHDPNLPSGFAGCRIAQISDLHNAEFGKNNQDLLDILTEQKPDLILFTGDFVDSDHTDENSALSFAADAADIAPCYFVPGNHEAWLSDSTYLDLEGQLEKIGVTVLRNEAVSFERNGDTVQLVGIDDPDFVESGSGMFDISDAIVATEIADVGHKDSYRILLSHRPETFAAYVEQGVNLTFSGHAHGGQFRFPFVGGLVAPNQGLFPKYDSGVFTEGNSTMVVSRGLGNSIIPFRINNRPEVVIAILHSGTGA